MSKRSSYNLMTPEPTLVIQPKRTAMILPYISEVVQNAANAFDIHEKVMILREADHPVLRNYLKMAIDHNLQWDLPPGAPPFTPCEEKDVEHVLYNEFPRVCRIFLKGSNPNLKPARREQLFVFFLESLYPKDARFFIDVVKDRKLPEGLTEEIIRFAFPNL